MFESYEWKRESSLKFQILNSREANITITERPLKARISEKFGGDGSKRD